MAKGFRPFQYQRPDKEYREWVLFKNQRLVKRGDALLPTYSEPGVKNEDLLRFKLMKRTLTINVTDEEGTWVAETVGLKIDGENEVTGEGDTIPAAIVSLAGNIQDECTAKFEDMVRAGEFNDLAKTRL